MDDDEFKKAYLNNRSVEQLEDTIMLLRTADSPRVADVQANPPQSSVVMARHDGDTASHFNNAFQLIYFVSCIDSDDEPEEE